MGIAKRTVACRAALPAIMLSLCLGASPVRAAGGGPAVDAELVFAVDASESMEDWEWRLEMAGIGAAFRSSAVQQVIASLPHRRIAVALVVWADATTPADISAWRLIDGGSSAVAFAGEMETWPRRVGGGTGMGAGIAASVRLIEAAPFRCDRRIIDVSGDGPEPLAITSEAYPRMPEARALAERAQVTVNGLAIVKDRPDLYDWYQDYVADGPGAFIMQIKDVKDFAAAFQKKLLRELQQDVSRLEPDRRTAEGLILSP